MRHHALSILAPALALGLAACEPLPPQPEFSPMIAPVGAGVGLPSAGPATARPAAGAFTHDPVTGSPIIEETLTDVPGDMNLPPVTPPLDPSISAAVNATNVPTGTSGTLNTVPLGAPVMEPPLATVPGGPLPEPRFQGSGSGAEGPSGFDDSRLAPAPAPVPAPVPAPTTPGTVSTASSIAVTPISAQGARPRGISDEQDFGAVSERETIETDAGRLARLRASRREVAPEPVPARPADAAPNIVAYAIAAPNAVGEPLYRRSGLLSVARLRDACRRYASPDRAQEAFLAAGGPRRDRRGLDPDGDGYACGWDPAPFRRAVN